jgi:geranylgeranyl transferase type-2 subunit alpha
MTTTALKKYPKVYWIWNHRRWCLENMPDGPGSADDSGKDGKDGYRISAWSQEMFVVEKMLSMDERNCALSSRLLTPKLITHGLFK